MLSLHFGFLGSSCDAYRPHGRRSRSRSYYWEGIESLVVEVWLRFRTSSCVPTVWSCRLGVQENWCVSHNKRTRWVLSEPAERGQRFPATSGTFSSPKPTGWNKPNNSKPTGKFHHFLSVSFDHSKCADLTICLLFWNLELPNVVVFGEIRGRHYREDCVDIEGRFLRFYRHEKVFFVLEMQLFSSNEESM